MNREDHYFNRNKETPISSKNVNDYKDRKFVNSFINDENNKNSNCIQNCDNSSSDLNKDSMEFIKYFYENWLI